MKKMERMLAIVLELQAREWNRAEDLAATFEVSKRTIYRDIQALCEAGVPVISITGQGYSLMEGYFLPPLNFNVDEALMLVLGSDFMAQNFDAQYRHAAETAATKIEAAMPTHRQNDLAYLRQNINFYVPPNTRTDNNREHLQQLRRAIIENRQIKLHYIKKFGKDGIGEQSVRTIDPYSLARLAMDWYIMAYCNLRQAFRVFRLSRVEKLQILPNQFPRNPDYDEKWLHNRHAENLAIQIMIAPHITRWIQESVAYYPVELEETAEGTKVTMFVNDERELVQWLLGWGADIRVLAPKSLQDRLKTEAQKIIDLYS